MFPSYAGPRGSYGSPPIKVATQTAEVHCDGFLHLSADQVAFTLDRTISWLLQECEVLAAHVQQSALDLTLSEQRYAMAAQHLADAKSRTRHKKRSPFVQDAAELLWTVRERDYDLRHQFLLCQASIRYWTGLVPQAIGHLNPVYQELTHDAHTDRESLTEGSPDRLGTGHGPNYSTLVSQLITADKPKSTHAMTPCASAMKFKKPKRRADRPGKERTSGAQSSSRVAAAISEFVPGQSLHEIPSSVDHAATAAESLIIQRTQSRIELYASGDDDWVDARVALKERPASFSG